MSSKALVSTFQRPDAGIKLICFNWAGGGANFYCNTWAKLFPDFIEVKSIFGVCLPGRERRFKEPVCSKLDVLLDELSEAIYQQCKDRPFAFWGHSLGALFAYEMCCVLKTRYDISPDHMFLSGVSAPHTQSRKDGTVDISQYSDEEFVGFLKKLAADVMYVGKGGTPSDIVENKEFLSLFLPALKADYELVNQFSFDHPKDRFVLHCPVDIFDGADDRKHDLDAWNDITRGRFTKTMLPGGHFYLKDDANTQKLVRHIVDSLLKLCF